MIRIGNIVNLISDPMFWAIVVLTIAVAGIVYVVVDFIRNKDKSHIRRYHYTRRHRKLHRA